MAKKAPSKDPPADRLAALAPAERLLLTHVLNGVALGTLEKDCSVEAIAGQLGKKPERLKPMLRRLIEKGYVTVEGQWSECVYPTAEALQAQDPGLTAKQAAAVVAKLKRPTNRKGD